MAELDGQPTAVRSSFSGPGHLALANHRAFARCGVTRDSPDPPFGRFDRDPATGALTGLVRETAAHRFLTRLGAADTVRDHVVGLERVFEEFLGYGITSLRRSRRRPITGTTAWRTWSPGACSPSGPDG
jgi:predicted amidohydrolase YtcJ